MIVVPPPPPPSSSAGPAAVSAILPLTDAPSLLRSAPLGAILQGAVVSNNPGALVVQTAQGQLSLAVSLAGLKVGQAVTLTLQPGSGNGGQVLIQADRPPQPGATTVADLLPSLQSGAQPARPGAVVQATVIRPGDTPTPNGSAPPPVANAGAPQGLSPPAPSLAGPNAPPPSANAPALGSPSAPAPTQAAPLQAAPPLSAAPQAATPAATATPTPNAQGLATTPATPASTPSPQGSSSAPPPTTAPTVSIPPPSSGAPAAQPPASSTGTSSAPAPTPTAAPTASSPSPSAPPPSASSTSLSSTGATAQATPPARGDLGATPGFLLGASSGDRIPVRVVALLPGGPPPTAPPTTASTAQAPTPTPVSTAPNAPPPLAPGHFIGSVVGASANGSAIVQAGVALITLEGVSAPANSAVILAPATLRAQPSPPMAAINNPALAAALPGVGELISAANATGGAAQAAMQAILPRLGPQMAAGMVFFMRALRTGELNEWLGKDARTAIERSGRASSVKKASAELEQISRANESGGEWSSYPIPIGVGGHRVEPIRLHVRQAEEDGEQGGSKGGKGKPTRFLIDVTLSRLGRLQLDGLARLPKLDLVLRSESPLDPAIQQPLRRFFADVTSARGIQGEMSFQVAPPIDPAAATPTKARPGIMV